MRDIDIQLTAAKYRLDIHSKKNGHVICRDANEWAVIEPDGNVHFSLNSLAVARAWCSA